MQLQIIRLKDDGSNPEVLVRVPYPDAKKGVIETALAEIHGWLPTIKNPAFDRNRPVSETNSPTIDNVPKEDYGLLREAEQLIQKVTDHLARQAEDQIEQQVADQKAAARDAVAAEMEQVKQAIQTE